MRAYKEGLNVFTTLFTFKDYKPGERLIKLLFMPLAVPFCVLMYLFTALCYTIERVLSPIFRRFLIFQLKMMQTRANTTDLWRRRGYSVLNVIVTILLLPFIMTYFIALLLKSLGKYLMRYVVLKLDFAVRFTPQDIELFDDFQKPGQNPMTSMMQDAQNTESLGKILEQYVSQVPEDEPTIIDDDDSEREDV